MGNAERYKIIDMQGSGCIRDEVFSTRKEAVERLYDFHVDDPSIEEWTDYLKELRAAEDWTKLEMELVEMGCWEIVKESY